MATARVRTNSALWLKPSAGMTATEHKEASCGGKGDWLATGDEVTNDLLHIA